MADQDGKSPRQKAAEYDVSIGAGEIAALNFTLPAGTTLNDDDLNTVQSTDGTSVHIALSSDNMRISFQPPLLVVIKHWYVENVLWQDLTYNFSSAQFSVKVTPVSAWYALDKSKIVSEKITDKVVKMVKPYIADTPLARPGYKPMDDPDIEGTLKKIKANFDQSQTPSSTKLNLTKIGGFSGSVQFRLTQGINRVSTDGAVRIAAGAVVNIGALTPQNAADIKGWFADDKEKRVPPSLDAITVEFPAGGILIQTKENGRLQDAALVNKLRIARGAQVTIETGDLQLLGKYADYEQKEHDAVLLLSLFFNTLQAAGAGASGDSAVRLGAAKTAADNPRTNLVKGIARDQLEKEFTKALIELIANNLDTITHVFPNFSLLNLFGIDAVNFEEGTTFINFPQGARIEVKRSGKR
jgi:hypothetical protein